MNVKSTSKSMAILFTVLLVGTQLIASKKHKMPEYKISDIAGNIFNDQYLNDIDDLLIKMKEHVNKLDPKTYKPTSELEEFLSLIGPLFIEPFLQRLERMGVYEKETSQLRGIATLLLQPENFSDNNVDKPNGNYIKLMFLQLFLFITKLSNDKESAKQIKREIEKLLVKLGNLIVSKKLLDKKQFNLLTKNIEKYMTYFVPTKSFLKSMVAKSWGWSWWIANKAYVYGPATVFWGIIISDRLLKNKKPKETSEEEEEEL